MDLQKVYKLGDELLAEHGLVGWDFQLDAAKSRFGICRHGPQIISISRVLAKLNNEDAVRDTILHEIAHALLPRGVRHGPLWRIKAQSIGCNAQAGYDDSVVVPAPNHTGTCPNCHRTIKKFRRRKIACGVCCRQYNSGLFDQAYLIKWD